MSQNQRVFVEPDFETGRVLVGTLPCVLILKEPHKDLIYTDWEGSWVRPPTKTVEIGEPILMAGVATLGFAMIMTYLAVAAGASVVDMVTRRRGTNRLRYKVDQFFAATPLDYTMK